MTQRAPGARNAHDVRRLEDTLNATLARGDFLEAYEGFCDEKALCSSPLDEPSRVLGFLEWAEAFVDAVPVRSVVANDLAYSEWRIVGHSWRARGTPRTCVVGRRWRDGKVIQQWVRDRPGRAQARARTTRPAPSDCGFRCAAGTDEQQHDRRPEPRGAR